MSNLSSITSATLKQARRASYLKQKQLADKLKMNTATISRYETGKLLPPVDKAAKMADILEIEKDRFMRNHAGDYLSGMVRDYRKFPQIVDIFRETIAILHK